MKTENLTPPRGADITRQAFGLIPLVPRSSLSAVMRDGITRGVRVCFVLLLTAGVSGQPPAGPADRAAPRTDQNSMVAHAQLVEKARRGRIDVYFEGDSIVRRWGALDYPELLANWNENFHGWNAADFGWGADRTE